MTTFSSVLEKQLAKKLGRYEFFSLWRDDQLAGSVPLTQQIRLVTDNPGAHVPKPNPNNERDRIATVEEWDRLKAVLAPHLRRLLTVAYHVGPRKGELLNLQWSYVDMRRKEFTLRRTKNNEVRIAPMTPAVHQVFLELWQERRLWTPFGCSCIKGSRSSALGQPLRRRVVGRESRT